MNSSFSNQTRYLPVVMVVAVLAWAIPMVGRAQKTPDTAPSEDQKSKPPEKDERRFFVREYRVQGGEKLVPNAEVEEAVYPFLGPYRSSDDVEHARTALEKVYRDKGFQTVSVVVPPQQVKGGIITLQVNAGKVGRLRVKGSRYFSPQDIADEAPSLAEGRVPNFNAVSRDLLGLNQVPGRRVEPSLRAGVLPGTVDVDLNVKDSPPVHGSIELNNRYSADTTALRVNGSVSYDNLWQLGHTIGGSFQIAPEDPNEVKVFSAYYLAPVPTIDWLSLMLQGTKQDSNVSTLGGIGVAGKGDVAGLRAIISLPAQKDYFHSISLGLDYKHFTQDLNTAGTHALTPVTYYPFSAAYSGTWMGKGYETDLNAAVDLHLRGMGSSQEEFELNRHGADGSFIYYRGDFSHTHDLPGDLQIFGKVQGQMSNKALINSEQFSGGGLGTARGYLESEVLGDNALLGSVELRSPSLTELFGKEVNEWRFYLFGEGGYLTINDPLPEQRDHFTIASVGAGTRLKLADHINGSFDAGVPLFPGVQTSRYAVLFTFRVWADF